MTVKLITSATRYQGASTDEKPAAPEGSTFHCVDTGEVYVSHDGGWVQDLRLQTALMALM